MIFRKLISTSIDPENSRNTFKCLHVQRQQILIKLIYLHSFEDRMVINQLKILVTAFSAVRVMTDNKIENV
jgi:hypothetical protein